MSHLTCNGCHKPITGKFIRALGEAYHPKCFICKTCRKEIKGEFYPSGKSLYHLECYQKKAGQVCAHCHKVLGEAWKVYDKKKYHEACLRKIIREKCDVCGDVLEGEYIQDPWGKRAHAFHNCHICNSCSRIISPRTSSGGHIYKDGRAICGYCDRTAIKGSIKASFSKRKVQAELEKIGFKDIPKNTKIHLVDQIALSNQSTYDLAKGLTRTEFQFKNNRRTGMVHGIYILHGLPRIEFEGIVAHELMHVWLNENDFKLSPMHTEGICNLASYWIYKRNKSELAEFLIKSLMENNDPTYGNGFRLMLKRAQKMGWKKLIAELMQNKQGFEESIWKRIFG